MRSIKISDTNQYITSGSRADIYWQQNKWVQYYKALRPGLNLPADLQFGNNVQSVLEKFKLKGVGFGNWVTIEDRLNYVNAMIISFYDLNKVLRFNYNIGFEKTLSIAFGERGHGSALAHYEPLNNMINITRYEEGNESKVSRFLTSGGVGSFSHEYGHFLDYFAGQYLDRSTKAFALTNGRSLSTKRTDISGSMRKVMDDIIEMIIWKKPGLVQSNYYKRLNERLSGSKGKGDYFIRRNEMFARAFEVYVQSELRRMNIKNNFLTHTKYSEDFYLRESEIQNILPLMKKLTELIRNKIN